jgi:Ser/Thr protein kinase RdoA (MazF antagonist)
VIGREDAYSLRRWPTPHPDRDRLSFIHAVQDHFVQSKIDQVPRLRRLPSGETFCNRDGAFWELSSWVPGSPTFHQHANQRKLAAAMELLAALHNSASQLSAWTRMAECPAIRLRAQMLHDYDERKLVSLAAQIDDRYPSLTDLCRKIVEHAVRLRPTCQRQLQRMAGQQTRLFPCIKDIWHDHLLFTDDEVTGIIDFGATQVDSPAGDIARLLGSLVRDETDIWRFAIDVYRSKRPLSDVELRMIPALDLANVVYSGINWIRWLYVDGRTFAAMDQIAVRLNSVLTRQQTRLISLPA